MKAQRKILDLYSISSATDRAINYAKSLEGRIKAFKKDSDESKRLSNQNCKWCYYCTSNIYGQAFTNWVCSGCGVEESHPNTGIPMLCQSCAKLLHLCVKCGGDIDMKMERDRDLSAVTKADYK